jgi:hypothetical protein
MARQFTTDPGWWSGVTSQMRDIAVNDNMTEFEFAQMRRGLMEWAASRMNEPAFRPWAIRAMTQAQTMRRAGPR